MARRISTTPLTTSNPGDNKKEVRELHVWKDNSGATVVFVTEDHALASLHNSIPRVYAAVQVRFPGARVIEYWPADEALGQGAFVESTGNTSTSGARVTLAALAAIGITPVP